MDMTRISSGKLRAIGYDARSRTLRVELDDGRTLQYSGIGEALWNRLRTSGSAWSFYRDNIEDEFAARQVPGKTASGAVKNPLDDLFS